MLVGIDLGTTFSAVARVGRNGKAEILENRDGERTTPSVVMFEDGSVVVGDTAKGSSISEPENVCQFVKRMIGDIAEFLYNNDLLDENGEINQTALDDVCAAMERGEEDD